MVFGGRVGWKMNSEDLSAKRWLGNKLHNLFDKTARWIRYARWKPGGFFRLI